MVKYFLFLALFLQNAPSLEVKAKPWRCISPCTVRIKGNLHGDYCPSAVEFEVVGVVKHKWSINCDERSWSEEFDMGYGNWKIYVSLFDNEDHRALVNHVNVEVGQ